MPKKFKSRVSSSTSSLGLNTPANLFDLRGKVKRNPSAYKNDVLRQLNHWSAILSLLKISTTMNSTRQRNKDLQNLIEFLGHVVYKYPNQKKCMQFPLDLLMLLSEYSSLLNHGLRKCIIKILVRLESHSIMISADKILPLFFQLLSVNDKSLRFLIYSSIIKIIVRVNKNKGKKKKKHSSNTELNKSLEIFLYSMLKEENVMTVKKSLSVLIELYRRKVWRNTKIIQIISDLCLFHKNTAIVRNSLHFMLGHQMSMYLIEDELKEMDSRKLKSEVMQLKYNTRRRTKKLLQIAKLEDDIQSKKENNDMLDESNGKNDLSAIRSLNNPQLFAEKLFQRLKRNKDPWDVRLLIMNVLSRCISSHQLFIFPFYSFMMKYLKHFQKNVTKIIAYTAQAVHRLVPPEIIHPVIKHICDEFVGQFASMEAIAVGINAIRWICRRQPLALNKCNGGMDLLQDLALYTKYKKDRGVQMAARSLIHLYRIENPYLLANKNRGKYFNINQKNGYSEKEFGDQEIMRDIPGAQLLDDENHMLLQMRIANESIGRKKIEITEAEANFLDLEMNENEDENEDENKDESEDEDIADAEMYIIVNEKNDEKREPLLSRRILSQEDLNRLKELRVKNLMKLWNRKRDEVGLKEDRESGDEEFGIEPSDIQSVTFLEKQRKMERKAIAMRNSKTSNKMTWKEYSRKKGGTMSNIEAKRMKSFRMTKYASRVIGKSKRSNKLKRAIMQGHRKRLRKSGKHIKRRR